MPWRLALMLALMLVAALPAHAQWKWRDKSGQITASDLPPPHDIADKDILQRPDPAVRRPLPVAAPAPSAASAPARRGADKELDARKRAAEQEQQAQAKAAEEKRAEQRADNCRRARSQLAALQTGQRIARINDKGEREILDDKGRADEMRRANDVITSDCK
jgi:hypothetical protein